MSDTATDGIRSAWDDVIGQSAAVQLLRNAAANNAAHAWLFIGPNGSGKRAAAKAFGGDLLAHDLDESGDLVGAQRVRSLAREAKHPDLSIIEREGARISFDQAREIVRQSSLSATEGRRKVVVLSDFHLLSNEAAAILLKTIEEPAEGRFFIVLADETTPELVTIASRCVQVRFARIADSQIAQQLMGEGADEQRAQQAASFANGSLERARILVEDQRLALRLGMWRDLPRRLNGSGHSATSAIDDIRAAIDDSEVPLRAIQDREKAEMEERVERYGQRGSAKKELEERHKRQLRRLRGDELKMGLGVLAGTYRDEMLVATDPTAAISAIESIQALAQELVRHPNEEIQLIALALRLPPLT
ncbi:MAG: hypothetical protein KDA95_00345 [Acidimicrobiales bacterium]|nr:hypothetical protein [Acidimicrobiales bacterium]